MRKLYSILLGAVCFASLHGFVNAGEIELATPEEVGISSERLGRLKQNFERLLEEEATGGIQILISRSGRVVMHEHLGMADIEAGRPVTADTLFRVASMTKPIVGVAMMMLYEEGYFSLQDPVSKYIPEFSRLRVYAGEDDSGAMILEDPIREATIHDLMQHTAGFTYGIFGNTRVDRLYLETGVLDDTKTQQGFIDTLAAIPLLYQPGERWEYSVATDVQGYLIEKWTGMELGEFLRQRIFGPLAMDETMAWVPPASAQDLATVYTHDTNGNLSKFEGGPVGGGTVKPARFSGGGQLISTSDDYWRFCQMLLNGGSLDGVRLLSPASVEMMSQNRMDRPMSIPGWITEQGFGLNFAVITDPAKTDYPISKGEYFWAGINNTVFWIDPEKEIVAIMMTQYRPFEIGRYSDLFHRLVNSAVIE